jgi:hypothetical protein
MNERGVQSLQIKRGATLLLLDSTQSTSSTCPFKLKTYLSKQNSNKTTRRNTDVLSEALGSF